MGNYCNDLLIWFGRITISTMILPIVFALYQKKHLNKPLKLFLFYCLVTLFINLFEQWYIWASVHIPFVHDIAIKLDRSTNFLIILYVLRDFLFIGLFYYALLPFKYGFWVRGIAILLSIGVLINCIFIEGFIKYGIFNPTSDGIFMVVLPLFYLAFLYNASLNIPIQKISYFWISLGLFIPNLIGLFLYFVGDAIYGGEFCLFVYGSTVKNGFEIIGQILMAVGFWQARYAKYLPLPNG